MPPPRIDEIDFDLDSIKYNRKNGDNDNQQVLHVGNNLKNKGNKETLNGKEIVGAKTVDSISDDSNCKDLDLSQKIETSSHDKIVAVKENKLHKAEKMCNENERGDSRMSADLDLVKNEIQSAQKAVDKETSKVIGDTIDVTADSHLEKIDQVHEVKDSQEQLKTENNAQTEQKLVNEASVCSNVVNGEVKDKQLVHTIVGEECFIGDGVKLKSSKCAVEDIDRLEDQHMIARAVDKETEELKAKNSSDIKEPVLSPKTHIGKLDLKQICDNSSELMKNKCVSTPDFESSSSSISGQSHNGSSGISQSESSLGHSQLVKLKDIHERTTLKGCMSESVLKCDKSNARPEKSPFLRRKVESTYLTDQSDPLQSYQKSQDDSIFQSSLEMEEQLQKHRFKLKKALEYVILSTSPYIHYDLPYLETEQGSKCELRKYFPEEIYWSHHFRYY